MTILIHEFKQNLKSFLIWEAVIGGMVIVFMLLFPSMKDSVVSIEDAYSNMGSFSQAFGMDKISFASALGFYAIEAGAVVGLGGAMYAALVGAGILSKEEGLHTAEFLLTHPIKRVHIVLAKYIYVLLQVLVFNVICYLCAIVSFLMINEKIDFKEVTLFNFSVLLLEWEIACIAMCISSFQKKTNVGIGIGIASLLYFLNLMANASDKVEWLRYITPFSYSDAAEVVSSLTIDAGYLGVGIGIAVICTVITFIKYTKKDIQ